MLASLKREDEDMEGDLEDEEYICLLKVKALLIKNVDALCMAARGPTSESMEKITLDTGVVLMLLLSTTNLVVLRRGDLLTLMPAVMQQRNSSSLSIESGGGELYYSPSKMKHIGLEDITSTSSKGFTSTHAV